MKEKYPKKKPSELLPAITPILVTGNDRLTPYIQVFTHEPENITQRTLGMLFGVFKINDISVDSAFIVNFLVSELKKEYYGNPRRTPAGSFEAGLNRINIALSELAKQGNIAWIGKLESAICALEKNGMMHFSVTGNSQIALFREKSLSLISEGLAPKTATPNPLKTFTEISSGKLHPEDLVILGTYELFDFLPREKMERNAKHFNYQEFTRFLHTALTNEYELCGALTVLLKKEIIPPNTKSPVSPPLGVSPESIPNIFSAKAFHRNIPKQPVIIKEDPEKIQADKKHNGREGHFYIQQQHSPPNDPHKKFKEAFLLFRENLANILDKKIEVIRNLFRQWRRSLKEKITSRRMPEEKNNSSSPSNASSKESVETSIGEPQVLPQETHRDEQPSRERNFFHFQILSRLQTLRNIPFTRYISSIQRRIASFFHYLFISLKRLSSPLLLLLFRNLHKVGAFLLARSRKEKKIIILTCLFLLAISFFLLSKKEISPKENPQQDIPQAETPPSRETIFSKEKNMLLAKEEDFALLHTSPQSIQKIFIVNENTLILLEGKSVVLLSSNNSSETFPLPEEDNSAITATYMKDLSLLFVLTQKGSLISFSPISKKFSTNNLALEKPSPGKFLLGSYLTYLYVADTEKNTILRYPRAEGGFGSPLVWLSSDSNISLSDSMDITIDESIYISKPDSLLRMANRKESPLPLEKTAISPQFESVTTQSIDDPLLLSDTKNNRVLIYAKDGSIKKQLLLPEQMSPIRGALLPKNDTLLLQTEKEIFQMQL